MSKKVVSELAAKAGSELRAKAGKYRALARQSNDDEAAQGIFELACELEQQARDMEKAE
jgi:hypothetical protein